MIAWVRDMTNKLFPASQKKWEMWEINTDRDTKRHMVLKDQADLDIMATIGVNVIIRFANSYFLGGDMKPLTGYHVPVISRTTGSTTFEE